MNNESELQPWQRFNLQLMTQARLEVLAAHRAMQVSGYSLGSLTVYDLNAEFASSTQRVWPHYIAVPAYHEQLQRMKSWNGKIDAFINLGGLQGLMEFFGNRQCGLDFSVLIWNTALPQPFDRLFARAGT